MSFAQDQTHNVYSYTPSSTAVLPTHGDRLMPFQDTLIDWLGQDTSEPIVRRDSMGSDFSALHVVTKVM
jgi:hypothetical protein